MGLPLLLGIFAIPYLYQALGAEKIGILTLVWALIGYFSLFDFGLGRALTQQVSTCIANDQVERLPSLVKTGLIFTTFAGLAGAVLLLALAYPLALQWLNVSKAIQQDVFISLVLAAFGVPMTTVTTGLRGVLEAYEDFQQVNVLRMFLGISNFVLPVLSVIFVGPSLAWIVGGMVFARAILLIAHFFTMNIRLPTGWNTVSFSKAQLGQLFSFGAWMTVSNVVGPLMVTADRFIISATMGASVVAYYTVPAEFLIRLLILPAALTSALFPRLTAVISSKPNEAKILYKKCLKVVTATLLPVCILIACLSKLGLTLWLGSAFAEQSWVIVSVMSIGLLINGIAHVPFAAIQALGNAKFTAYLHLMELVFYIPLLLVCLHFFGLIGAAIAWSIRIFFDAIALLTIVNFKLK
jgi:O-antigen/teichoic acid export membrane protein